MEQHEQSAADITGSEDEGPSKKQSPSEACTTKNGDAAGDSNQADNATLDDEYRGLTGGFWAILEQMGHVRTGGYVTEEEKFGVKMGRIEIPGPDGKFVTQWFGGQSVYRMTPTTEELARVAAKKVPAPINQWELPEPKQITNQAVSDFDDDDVDDHDYDDYQR